MSIEELEALMPRRATASKTGMWTMNIGMTFWVKFFVESLSMLDSQSEVKTPPLGRL